MKLKKYEHSCFSVEKDDTVLVVDPGAWTTDFVVTTNIIAVVVTHEHADHFDVTTLQQIIDLNPECVVYAPQAVVNQAGSLALSVAAPGSTAQIGPFSLEFVGGRHATIHEDLHPPFENVGVIINGSVYHPGDSLVLPVKPVKVLSLPIVAPWEKVSESIDFLIEVSPEIAFPSHDAFLNQKGMELYDRWHVAASEKHGISYVRLTQPIEIDE